MNYDKKKLKIIELHKKGLSNKSISREVGSSSDYVSQIIRRHDLHGDAALYADMDKRLISADIKRAIYLDIKEKCYLYNRPLLNTMLV